MAQQERWANPLEYLLSCLGYAVGLGNIWRFPYLCYRNGGGAFLIPYFLTLFLCGIPLVYLETTLGQFANAGCISIFNINPLFKGAGYATVVINIIAIIYFSAIMSYPVLYMYHSFSFPLPWQSCDNSWNTEKCTEITGNFSALMSNDSITTPEDEFFHIKLLQTSPSIHHIGGIVWPVFWSNLFCWIVVYFCICNGVKSAGKIVYFTVLFPYVVLCVLFVRGVTLPGAWKGILFYILPDWDQLAKPKKHGDALACDVTYQQKTSIEKNGNQITYVYLPACDIIIDSANQTVFDHKVWADAASQVFYSLGPGWGGLVAMASFNQFSFRNLRSSIIIPLVNSGTSVWAGFVVFSVLGFASERAGIPVGQVAKAGPGLAFVTYPAAVSMMPASNFWAVIFFVMLFFLGIDSMFVTTESIIAGFLDEFPTLCPKRRLITVLTCLILFFCSIICNTEGGLHVIGLLDSHVALVCVPLVCAMEIIASVYTYGTKKLSRDILFMTGEPLARIWLILWKYIIPVILLLITVYMTKEISSMAGLCVALVSVILIPIHAARVLYQTEGSFLQRIKISCRPSREWGPSDPDLRLQWLSLEKEQKPKAISLNDISTNQIPH